MNDGLKEAIDGGEPGAIIQALRPLSPAERRAVAAELTPAHKSWPQTPREKAVALATFVTSTEAQLRKLMRSRPPDGFVDAVEALRPDWMAEAATIVAEGSPHFFDEANELTRRGISRRPTSDAYILGMIMCGVRRPRHVFDVDPSLLQHEVWRLFEVEGGGEFSLAAADKYTNEERSWSQRLLRHVTDGSLDRAKLLDATLGALERDFAPFRAGWFSRFHDALAPTGKELAARRDRYLRLLQSAVPATVTMAFEVIRTLDTTKPLPAKELVPAVAPLVLSRQKGTAIAAIRLLALAGKREPQTRSEIILQLATGLAHEAADVQKAALAVLEGWREELTDENRQQLADRGSAVAATLKKRAAALLERGAGSGQTSPLSTIEARRHSEPLPPVEPASPTNPSYALTPIATFDELLQEFAFVVEDASDPNQVERVLDGLSRLGADLPQDFAVRVGPLAKRAQQRRRARLPETPDPVQEIVVDLAAAWAGDGERTAREDDRPQEGMALRSTWIHRVEAILTMARAGASGTLLAMPTHRGGWVAPRALVARVLERGPGAVPITEYALALLRLAPEGREEALKVLARTQRRDEVVLALRYALGGDATVGATAAWWVAAARARAPDADDAAVETRHPGLGPDAGTAARWSWKVTPPSPPYTFYAPQITATPPRPRVLPPPELISIRRHFDPRRFGGIGAGYARSVASMWPGGTESYFGLCATSVAGNIDWVEARWGDVAHFELLRAPYVRFGPMAMLVLGVGLGAKEAGQSRMATEAAIAAISSGRVDAAALGEVLRRLRASGMIKLKRWSTTFREIANASAAHASFGALLIQSCLRPLEGEAPRDEGTLIKLLLELLTETGGRLSDADAWSYLRASKHHKAFLEFGPPA